MAETKSRNYATVVYEESATEGWRDILQAQHIKTFISPLHDSDKNADNEPKKPHYHVMVMFDSPTTKNAVKAIFEQIGAVGIETVKSLRAYARYLCHLDNPEKAQYKPSEVICYGGAIYNEVTASSCDRYKTMRDMICFIRDNNIKSYAQLMDIAMETSEDWFMALCDHKITIVVMDYIKSSAWRYDNDK